MRRKGGKKSERGGKRLEFLLGAFGAAYLVLIVKANALMTT